MNGKRILNLSLFLVLFLSSFTVIAQHSFGFEIAQTYQREYGVHRLDSIVVTPNGNDATIGNFIGVFYEFGISERVSLHNKLNMSRTGTSYLLYNENKKSFIGLPEIKAAVVGVYRISFEILPQFSFVRFGKLTANAFVGLNISANLVEDTRDVAFRDLPGVSKVFNSLDTAHNLYSLNLAYGGSIEYLERIVFWAKWQPSSIYSRKIDIDGNSNSFENKWSFFTVSIGYKFHSLRLKKKELS